MNNINLDSKFFEEQNKKAIQARKVFDKALSGKDDYDSIMGALEITFNKQTPNYPPLVFCFSFSSRTHYAFYLDQDLFKSEDEFQTLIESKEYEKFVETSESRFGIHDWNDSPDPSTISIGYTSTEIKSKYHGYVMTNFRVFLKSKLGRNSHGNIQKIPNKIFNHGTSLDIFNYLKSLDIQCIRTTNW